MTKRLMALCAVGVLAFLAALPALAQNTRVRFDVPFAFEFAGQQMRAGEYTVSRGPAPGAIMLSSMSDRKEVAYALAMPAGGPARASEQARIRFERYGSSYFLRQIWTGDLNGLQFQLSRSERAMLSAQAKRDSVLIVAKR